MSSKPSVRFCTAMSKRFGLLLTLTQRPFDNIMYILTVIKKSAISSDGRQSTRPLQLKGAYRSAGQGKALREGWIFRKIQRFALIKKNNHGNQSWQRCKGAPLWGREKKPPQGTSSENRCVPCDLAQTLNSTALQGSRQVFDLWQHTAHCNCPCLVYQQDREKESSLA